MPYSMEEMQRLAGGDAFFSLFPSTTVRNNMETAGVQVSASQVDRLWQSYQAATLEKGLKPYSKAGGGAVAAPLLQFMTADTGYTRNIVAAFLNALEQAVTVQGWEYQWLDPAAGKAAGKPFTAGESVGKALSTAGQNAKAFLAPTLDPVTNLVKYAAVALVAGAVIYGVYHGSKFLKSKRRKG